MKTLIILLMIAMNQACMMRQYIEGEICDSCAGPCEGDVLSTYLTCYGKKVTSQIREMMQVGGNGVVCTGYGRGIQTANYTGPEECSECDVPCDNSNCTCFQGKVNILSKYLLEDNTIVQCEPETCEYRETFEITTYQYCPQPLYSQVSSISSRRKRESIIHYAELDRTITIFTSDYQALNIIVTKGELTKLYNCPDEDCTIQVDRSFFLEDGTITVSVFDGEQVLVTQAFSVITLNECHIPHCLFCKEMISEFSCLPGGLQAFLIASGLIILCLMFAVVVWIIYFVKKYKLNLTLKSNPNMNIPLTTMCLMCLLVCAPACDDILYVQSELHDCFQTTTTETCSLAVDMFFNLPRTGKQLCLRLLDSEENFVSDMKVTLVTHEIVAQLSRVYYTSGFYFEHMSWSLCNWDAGCEDSCPRYANHNGEWYAPEDPQVGPAIGLDINYMAVCMDRSGCAGNGCVSCQDGCAKGLIGIKPIANTVAEVMQIINAEKHPILEIEVGDELLEVIFRDNEFVELAPNITIAYETGTYYSFVDNYKVLRELYDNNGSSWLAAANDGFDFGLGSIGEIQGFNLESFVDNAEVYFNKAIFPSPFVQNLQVEWSTISNTPYVLNGGRPYLPRNVGLVHWQNVTDYRMFGLSTEPFSATFGLEVKNISFTRIRTEVCPELINVIVSGCHSCNEGFTIEFDAKSNCLSGSTTLKVTPLAVLVQTPTVDLTTEVETYMVEAFTDYVVFQLELCLISRQRQSCRTVQVSLEEPDIPPPLNDTLNNGTHFMSKWSIGAKIGFSIGVSFGGIFSILLLLLGAYLLWKIVAAEKTYEKVEHFYKEDKEEINLEETDEVL